MESGQTIRLMRALLRAPVFLLVAAIIATSAHTARAQGIEANRILTLSGRVSSEHSGELWALMPGQTIGAGEIMVTGPDGYAQLELPDHSIIEIFPNSRMVLRPSRFNWKDLVEIYLGKIRLQIQHLTKDDSPYHVTSPTAVISIRGTVLDVEVDPSEGTTVQVETGTIGVRHRLLPGREVIVETGQTIRVVANVPLAAFKPTSPLVVAGRIAKIAGDTLAQIGGPGGITGGGHGGATTPKSGSSGAGASTSSSGSSAGTNSPKPPPGQDGGGSGSPSAPPGDVVKP